MHDDDDDLDPIDLLEDEAEDYPEVSAGASPEEATRERMHSYHGVLEDVETFLTELSDDVSYGGSNIDQDLEDRLEDLLSRVRAATDPS